MRSGGDADRRQTGDGRHGAKTLQNGHLNLLTEDFRRTAI
jgi:hypothetical protein